MTVFRLADFPQRPLSHFEVDALRLAPSLLGDYLVHVDEGTLRIGRIVDCFNVVCGGEGQRGHAVLVRAVEPVVGVSLRSDGQGRLTRAMGLTRARDGAALTPPSLYIAAGPRVLRPTRTARVGVGYAGKDASRPWRFFDPKSVHVSRPSAKSLGG